MSLFCPSCKIPFATKQTLLRHTEKLHNSAKNSGSLKCPGDGCEEGFNRLHHLRSHLETEHGIEMKERQMTFANTNEFQEWLAEEEALTSSKYVRHCSSHKRRKNNCVVTNFYCHRSGNYRPKGKEHRQLKSQGSCKIGYTCPSSICVIETNNEVKVSHHYVHFGHDFLLGHLNLSESDKNQLVGKLSQGVSKEKVLEDVRSSVSEKVERLHLLTKKDLTNLCAGYGIVQRATDIRLHENDAVSVATWVADQRTRSDNCVIFYKEQNSSYSGLENEDFVLVIMTILQRQMVMKFGTDRICIDSTHGMTGYDFELTTMMVIDEYEEGFPVAFCISSRVNTEVLTAFFGAVKDITNVIQCKVLMTDDAPAFFNAWSRIMGPPQKRLLCSWHVDRAWQSKLNGISDKEKRAKVYKALKTCLFELDQEKFEEMFSELLEQLKSDTETEMFYLYLLNNYASRPQTWAYSFRQNVRMNTNMHIESFHGKIKTIYMDGKKSKRVDKCICTLNAYLTDKAFERLIKVHKGKRTFKMANLVSRHKSSLGLVSSAHEVSSTSWIVPSETKQGLNYTVMPAMDHECSCKIICSKCGVCYKAYQCNCLDYAILGNVCKHIHAVKMNSLNGKLPNCTSRNDAALMDDIQEAETVILSTPKKSGATEGNKTRILSKLQAAAEKIAAASEFHDSTTKNIIHHIDCVLKLANLSGVQSDFEMLESVRKEPSNKSSDKQNRFYGVKQKRSKSKKSHFQKPTASEVADIENVLLQKELFLLSDNEHTY